MLRSNVIEWKRENEEFMPKEKDYKAVVDTAFSDPQDRLLAYCLYVADDEQEIQDIARDFDLVETIGADNEDKNEAEFLLHYYCSNGGDGSANVQICYSADEAAEKDESQCEGWGEPSCDSCTVVVRDGKPFVKESASLYDYVNKNHTWFTRYIPLEQVVKK